MKELILYIGRIGSGKSYHYRKHFQETHTYISQDEQGAKAHRTLFEEALIRGEDIVVDRQNNMREHRDRYLIPAKAAGYTTKIIEFKVHRSLCEQRVLTRKDHPTITKSSPIRMILAQYDRQYQGVLETEADSHEIIKQSYYAPIQDLTHLTGKIMVIGDPHGTYKECMAAIDELKPDHVVFVGDIGDRGPGIRELFEYCLQNENVYSVKGNHCDKMARYLLGNKVQMSGGLDATAAQISEYTEEQRTELYEWIAALPTIIKLPKDYAVVHAGMNPDRPLEKQHYDTCLYIRNHGGKHMDDPSYPRWYAHEPCEALSKYHILFGHAIHDTAKVSSWATAIDMGAVYGTGLRVMIVDTNGEDTIHEWETPVYYKSSLPERSPFAKKEELVKQGYLRKSEFDNLVLYNYTDSCTFDRMWIPETLESRGTIYNKETNVIVSRAFPKFFNLNEHETTMVKNLNWGGKFTVFEKMDGSYGQLYSHKDQYRISTRGSFFSEQAEYATKMLHSKYNIKALEEFHKYSLKFEIIYPSNKIIIDYGDEEKLVLLGACRTWDGRECSWEEVTNIAKKCGFELPKVYEYTLDDMLRLKEEIDWDRDEGWVVLFEDGTRVKIKGTKYLEMAKILSHMSPLAFWDAMMERRADDYLVTIPEEIREQAEEIYDTLKTQVDTIQGMVDSEAQILNLSDVNREDKEQVKKFALAIQQRPKWMHGCLFQTMHHKDPYQTIVRMIRPTENVYVDLTKVLK